MIAFWFRFHWNCTYCSNEQYASIDLDGQVLFEPMVAKFIIEAYMHRSNKMNWQKIGM